MQEKTEKGEKVEEVEEGEIEVVVVKKEEVVDITTNKIKVPLIQDYPKDSLGRQTWQILERRLSCLLLLLLLYL